MEKTPNIKLSIKHQTGSGILVRDWRNDLDNNFELIDEYFGELNTKINNFLESATNGTTNIDTLAEIINMLNSLNSNDTTLLQQVNSNTVNIETLQTNLNRLVTQLDETISPAVETLQTNLSTLDQKVKDNETSTATALSNKVDAKEGHNLVSDELITKLTELYTLAEMNNLFATKEAVANDIKTVNDTITAKTSGIADIEDSIADFETRIETLETKAADTDTELNKESNKPIANSVVATKFETIDNTLETVQTTVSGLENYDDSEITARVAGIEDVMLTKGEASSSYVAKTDIVVDSVKKTLIYDGVEVGGGTSSSGGGTVVRLPLKGLNISIAKRENSSYDTLSDDVDNEGYTKITMTNTSHSYLLAKIEFSVSEQTNVTIDYIDHRPYTSYGYGYTYISKIDDDYIYRYANYYEDYSSTYYDTSLRGNTTTDSPNIGSITFENVKVGNHFIYILKRKYGSYSGAYISFKINNVNSDDSSIIFDNINVINEKTTDANAMYGTEYINKYINVGTIGTRHIPVYLDNGIPKTCMGYAGGTCITLNGSNKGGTNASIYAPTTYGATNTILRGSGSGAEPVWIVDTSAKINNDNTGISKYTDYGDQYYTNFYRIHSNSFTGNNTHNTCYLWYDTKNNNIVSTGYVNSSSTSITYDYGSFYGHYSVLCNLNDNVIFTVSNLNYSSSARLYVSRYNDNYTSSSSVSNSSNSYTFNYDILNSDDTVSSSYTSAQYISLTSGQKYRIYKPNSDNLKLWIYFGGSSSNNGIRLEFDTTISYTNGTNVITDDPTAFATAHAVKEYVDNNVTEIVNNRIEDYVGDISSAIMAIVNGDE